MNSEHVIRRGVLAIAFAGLLAGGAYARARIRLHNSRTFRATRKTFGTIRKIWPRIAPIVMPINAISITASAT